MKNEEFSCAMQACRKVILHSSFLVLHFAKLSFINLRVLRGEKIQNPSGMNNPITRLTNPVPAELLILLAPLKQRHGQIGQKNVVK